MSRLDYKTVLNLYLAMPKYNRSIRELHRQLKHKHKQRIESDKFFLPHLNTLWKWANENQWKQKALDQQIEIDQKVNKRIVNSQVSSEQKFHSIMSDLQEVSYLSLKKIVATLKQDLLKPIESASELKALCNSVTDILKQFSVLSGGVSSRSETISHSAISNKKQIRDEIMSLLTSLQTEDGIQLTEEDKSKLN